jgi:hypothetical protein
MARLQDSAIGDVFRSMLMTAVSGGESLRQDGDALVESGIRKGEGFGPKLCHRAPPISPDVLNGFTALGFLTFRLDGPNRPKRTSDVAMTDKRPNANST